MSLPRLLARRRGVLLGRLIVNGMLQTGAAIVSIVLARDVFDRAVQGSLTFAPLALSGCALALAIALTGWLLRTERVEAERLGQSYVRSLRSRLFGHLTNLEPRQVQRYSHGGLTVRFVADLTAIRLWVARGVARLIVALTVTAGTLITLATMSVRLAALVTVVLVGGVVSSALLQGPLLDSIHAVRQRRMRLGARIADRAATLAVAQANCGVSRERRRIKHLGRSLSRAMVRRATAVGNLQAVSDVSGRLATAGILLLGAFDLQRAATTPGAVVAAAAVVGLLSPSLSSLARASVLRSSARAAETKLREFLALPIVPVASRIDSPAPRAPARLRLESVTFGAAIRDLDAEVAPRARVALVGANASGKSTLLWLAAGLNTPDHGRVVLDEHDLRAWPSAIRRRSIGIASRDLPLVRGTLRSNITYRLPQATAQELELACHRAGLDRVLAELPDGFETKLVEQGANLSEGQRQRVALARAVLGEPRLLLLDEIERGLDPPMRREILSMLASYPGTVIMSTHDLDWVRAADIVWCLEQGRLVDSAPPAQALIHPQPAARLFAGCRAVGAQ